MLLNQLDNPREVTNDMIYISHYILLKRKVKTPFSAKISTLLTRVLRQENVLLQSINTNTCFIDMIAFLTGTVNNYKKVLDLVAKVMFLNNESCLCNYSIDICHKTISYCTMCSHNTAYWNFDTLLVVHTILSHTAKSKHHSLSSGDLRIQLHGAIEEMQQKTAALSASGLHWELLHNQIMHTRSMKYNI